jgi:uncharacterized protein YndB with AHSA1/START domain
VPSVQRTRTIMAPAGELWELLGDPHHLPRWWPRVDRVEAVTLTDAGELDAFTEVLRSNRGKVVRADFKRTDAVSEQRIVWAQQVKDTPFARILTSAETEVRLSGAHGGDVCATDVTIELRQRMRGFLARLGSHLVRRAAASTIEEALDGLERIAGRDA